MVRMKANAAGPQQHYMKGMVVDLPEAQAQMFIRGGYAVALETATVAPAEVATKAPAEDTVLAAEVETASVETEEPAQKATKKKSTKKKA